MRKDTLLKINSFRYLQSGLEEKDTNLCTRSLRHIKTKQILENCYLLDRA